MPVEEIGIWQAWMAKRGPLSVQRRVEAGFAQIAMMIANTNRDPKSKPMGLDKFLLWSHREEEEADQEMAALRELAKVARPAKDGHAAKKMWRRKAAAA